MNKTVGIVGLGIIGGSLAKAIKAHTAHTVLGFDIDTAVLAEAQQSQAIDGILDQTHYEQCDYLLIALYPQAVRDFFKENIRLFKKGLLIIDCAGVKQLICQQLSALASAAGVYFIGGHPMAGITQNGFQHSFAALFQGASIILCKDEQTNLVALKAAELFFLSIGFDNVTVTTAKEHDRIIAYTSQLAHIVSNAYIKSKTAKVCQGFTAGSYKDLTRVAWLNEDLWTELFMENREFLLSETESLIERLQTYTEALRAADSHTMTKLLREGRLAKEAVS